MGEQGNENNVVDLKKCAKCKPGTKTKIVTEEGNKICACKIFENLVPRESSLNTNI